MLKYLILDLILYPFLVIRLILQHLRFKNKVIIKKYYYGLDKKQYFLFCMPKNVTKNKIVFFINGSGWKGIFMFVFKSIGSFIGVFGYVSIIASHRNVPKYTYPSQVEDIIAAIKETLKIVEEGHMKKEFILMGYSSGAQIVTLLSYSNYLEQHGLSKNIIRGVISISGPINFNECKNKLNLNQIIKYVDTLTNKESADPYKYLNTNNLIPILCIHDERDPIVECDNSISFIDKVNQLDHGKGKLIILKDYYHHHILKIFLFPNYNQEIMKWIDQIDKK